MLWLLASFLALCLFCGLCHIYFVGKMNHVDTIVEIRKRKLIEWGKSFGGLHSETVRIEDCTFGVSNDNIPTVKVAHEVTKNQSGVELEGSGHCRISTQYFPSQYEQRHLLKSKEFDNLTEGSERRLAFIDFIASSKETNAAEKWLERVKVHMKHYDTPTILDDDNEYLSYFLVRKTCLHKTHEW